MKTVAFANQKGGSGKTTSAVNVAAAWARCGHRTLLVDLDGQASASLHLGVSRTDLSPSVAGVLYENRTILESKRGPGPDGLELVTGGERLRDADDLLGLPPTDLSDALTSARDGFDRVVVDCPPALGMLTLNGLEASDLAVVPTPPDFLNVRGFGQIRQTLERVGLPWRVLLTKLDRRTRLSGEVAGQFRDALGQRVLESEIRINVELSRAPAAGGSIFDHAPSSRGAADYADAANEIREALDHV